MDIHENAIAANLHSPAVWDAGHELDDSNVHTSLSGRSSWSSGHD